MVPNVPLVLRLMASSISVASRAGKIVRDVMTDGELHIVEKGINDYQTEADRSAQRCIIASLTKQFPNVTIIGEEGATDLEVPNDWLVLQGDEDFLKQKYPAWLENVTEEDVVVWVDPLDGTSEYTQGFLEHVTVLIGISVNKKAVGGVIHQPYYRSASGELGRTIWGLQEMGVGGFTPATPPTSLVVTTTRSHSSPLVEKCLQALNPAQVIRVGGAGYKVIQLLEGQASVYVFASPGCKKWDTCAPEAVLAAAGGRLTDVGGTPYEYGHQVAHPNKGGVLAALTTQLYQEVLDKIPQDVKDALAQ